MAGDALEQLLLEFGIDLSPAQAAGEKLRSLLGQLNDQSDQAVEKTKTAAAEQKNLSDQATSAARAALDAAVAAIAEESKKTAELKSQTEEYKKQASEAAARAANIATETAALQLQTAELTRQTAEIRKQRLEGGKQEGGGLFSAQSVSKIGGAAFGSTAGGLLGAFVGGDLIAHGIETAVEGVAHFIEKLKELSVEAGKLTQVEDRFQALARGAGVDGVQLLEKLSGATEGLVDRTTLAQFGMRALQSGLKSLSPDKLVQVTEAVVKLAESSGNNAKQAVDALGTALSRGGQRAGVMLARVTGLTHAQLGLAQLSPMLNRTQRDAESLDHAFAVLISEAAKLGEVPRTLDQASTQLKVVSKDLFLSFGKGFNESEGTQQFLKSVAEFAKDLEKLNSKAEEFGRNFGNALAVVAPIFTIIKEAAGLAAKGVGELVQEIGKLGKQTDTDATIAGLRTIGHALIMLKTPLDALLIGFKLIAGTVTGLFGTLDRQHANAGLQSIKDSWSQFVGGALTSKAQKEALDKELDASMDAIAKNKDVKTAKRNVPPPEDTSNRALDQANLNADKKYEQALLAQHKAGTAATLEQQKDAIAEAQRLNDEQYRSGEESLEQHLATKKALNKRSLDADLDSIHANFADTMSKLDAEAKDIQQEAKIKGYSPDLLDKQLLPVTTQKDTARQQSQTESDKAQRKYDTSNVQADKEANGARLAEQRKAIQDRLALTEEGIKAEEALEKQRYEQGAISASEYVQLRINGIQQLVAAQKKAAADELASAQANQGVTPQLVQGLQDRVNKIVQSGKEQLQALQQSIGELQLQAIQKNFGPQQKAIETQIQVQQSQPGVNFQTPQLVQNLLGNLRQQMSALTNLAQSPEAITNPDTWYKVYEQIESVYQAQVKWTQELEKMRDLLIPIGQSLDAIGRSIQANFHSKFAQNLAGNLQAGAQGLQKADDLGKIIAGKGTGPAKTPQQIAIEATAQSLGQVKSTGDQLTQLFNSLGQAVQQLTQNIQDAAQKTQQSDQNVGGELNPNQNNPNPTGTQSSGDPGSEGSEESGSGGGASPTAFANRLGAAITAVDSFTNSILNSKTALSGALGGASGGAGIGKTVSSAFGMAGPLGSLIGAGAGALLGGIMGQKNAEVKSNITNFEDTYKSVMNQFALNTNNLNDTIVQLQQLVNQISAMQSNSKKGSSQYQQLIDQYNQQIQQMEQQQNQIIINMQEMAAVSSAPIGQQSALGNLQTILQQYEQYIGAIQSVNQLMSQGQTQQQAQANVTMQQAAAYQYLTGALAQYENNLANELNQDEQQAINTALQLNDLLYQRQQLMLSYNDQVESILSQGVLTRQQTRAESAGQQIQQLTVSYNMQMDQLNEQISADQYSVSVANQIFQLATTRIGLENQLLQAQNAQTANSMAQIAALASLVAQIQSGQFASGALGALLGALPTVTNNGNTTGALAILLAMAGISSGPGSTAPSTDALDSLFTSAYQSRASMGYADFRASNL